MTYLPMVYAYIRVSTDKQTVENQRFEIQHFCKTHNLIVDNWFEETISGSRKKNVGEFGLLLRKLQKGDTLIVSELSRLGRNLMEVMSILHDCMEVKARVLTVKEKYELGDNINSKLLAFAFSLSAEIERQLISQRTKEALARKKLEGVVLGRPRGRKSRLHKLSGKENLVKELRDKGYTYTKIARKLNVHRITLSNFVKNNISSN